MTIVDALFEKHYELIAYLENKNEISMRIFAEENFKKNILLSIASYFEHRITAILIHFTERVGQSSKLSSFVYDGAINRKYHTLFEWGQSNANKFFSLFGEEFKIQMKEVLKSSPDLEKSVKAFLQLGQQRNLLVHSNFGEKFIEKTSLELYDEYKIANEFIFFVEKEINKHKSATLVRVIY